MAKKPENLKIVQVPINKLKPAKYNPRQLTEAQHKNLKTCIEKYGFVDPLVVNKNPKRKDIVIGGHQRLRIAKELEYKTVPCVYVSLMLEKEKELNVRLNKNTGEFDFDLLANNFDVEQLLEWGFEPLELDFMTTQEDEETDGDDEAPEPAKKAKSKRGEIYQIGEHLLMCGDCTDEEEVSMLLSDSKVDMLLTDPPYGVDYSGKNEMLNKLDKGNRVQMAIENDNIEDYRTFFKSFLEPIPMADYNTCYICMSGQELHNLRMAFEDAGYYWSDYLVWVKNNHVLGRKDYNAKHEFIMYGWKGRHKFYGGSSTTVLEYDRPHKSELHPTMKPVELFTRIIKDGSGSDAIVFDPFGGSGTTLIAAQKAGRKARIMEIEPIYCDVIRKRWSKWAGENDVEVGSDGL